MLMKLTLNISFWLCMAVIAWLVVQVFFFTSYRVPSGSMEPTLIPGDRILVNKMIPGARLFNIFASLRGEQVEISRLPGIRDIRRNDVVVCNIPNAMGSHKIAMHIMKYYVKRCIGLPGDSLEICNGFYHIRGLDAPLGNIAGQKELSLTPDSLILPTTLSAYPNDTAVGWTIKNFAPLYIPQEGDSITLDYKNFRLYEQAMEWELGERLLYRDSAVWLNDRRLDGYRFAKNYYFIGGDNVLESYDSRYWGFVPEEYIAGKAVLIWKSVNPNSGAHRMERVFTIIR
jgi:signal peptidase I